MKEDVHADGGMNRRDFLLLAAAAALAAGCQAGGTTGGSAAPREERVVDAGPAANYAADGVYGGYRDQGFFLIRSGGKLTALSAICTHRKCKLESEPDRSFYCACHGSTFDPGGRVTEGPATRNLPQLSISTSGQGHLLVKVPAA
jgi:Rieske Fe-S protein